MHVLAATALDSAKHLPPSVWLKVGIVIAAIIVVVFILRKIAGMNKIVLGVVVFVSCSILFFSWVYNRNEPKFLTPLIDRLAPFLPSAGSYNAKQQNAPKH